MEKFMTTVQAGCQDEHGKLNHGVFSLSDSIGQQIQDVRQIRRYLPASNLVFCN